MVVMRHQQGPTQQQQQQQQQQSTTGCFLLHDDERCRRRKQKKRGEGVSSLLLLLIPLLSSQCFFFVNAERWALSSSIPLHHHHHPRFPFLLSSTAPATTTTATATTTPTTTSGDSASSLFHRLRRQQQPHTVRDDNINSNVSNTAKRMNPTHHDKNDATATATATGTSKTTRRRHRRLFGVGGRSYDCKTVHNVQEHHKNIISHPLPRRIWKMSPQKQSRTQTNYVVQIRGGGRMGAAPPPPSNMPHNISTNALHMVARIVAMAGETLVPVVIVTGKSLVSLFRVVPHDAIMAQAGLLYCFAGGYYPTLFASVQAAKQCGWESAVHAFSDLTQEATVAVDALLDEDNYAYTDASKTHLELITKKTKIVLKNVDPNKINQALGALYTTWVGIEAVLHREFAGTISMALTIADYSYPIVDFTVGNPLRWVISREYHHWVPVMVEWSAKSVAVRMAWRMQRVRSTYSSAIAGGFIFSKAFFRVLTRQRKRNTKRKQGDDTMTTLDDHEEEENTNIDIIELDQKRFGLEDIVAIVVAGLGLYSQLNREAKKGFSFTIPYPIKLLSWPFDALENWIQWHITKEDTK